MRVWIQVYRKDYLKGGWAEKLTMNTCCARKLGEVRTSYATLELVERYRCRWGKSKESESCEVAVSDVFSFERSGLRVFVFV